MKKNTRIGKKTYFKGVIEQYSYIGDNCEIYASIGKYTSIGSNVKVVSATHPLSFISTSPFFYSPKKEFDILSNNKKVGLMISESKQISVDGDNYYGVIIGNDVWIGDNVLIKGGIIIGDGAVIGMGSVVTKNVEPYSIVAGNPAKAIKYRFDKETIEFLKNSKWWEIDHTILSKNNTMFRDIDSFKKWIVNVKMSNEES